MTAGLVAFLQEHLLPLGAWGVFAASILEELIAIIPSSAVQMASGFLFLEGAPVASSSVVTLFLVVVVPATLGVVVGSLPIYYAAYYGGKPAIDRFGRYVTLSWNDIESVQARFAASVREEVLIIVARALPVMPSVVVAGFAGVVRVPVRTYVICSLIGTFIRATILGTIGWQVGALYFRYAEVVSRLEKVGLALLVLVGLSYLLVRKRTTLRGRSKEREVREVAQDKETASGAAD